jgi:hypothetical protein
MIRLDTEQLIAAFDALESGVIVLDADQRVVGWNYWFASASHISSESAVGKTLDQLFPGRPLVRLTKSVAEALTLGSSALLTYMLNRDPNDPPAAPDAVASARCRSCESAAACRPRDRRAGHRTAWCGRSIGWEARAPSRNHFGQRWSTVGTQHQAGLSLCRYRFRRWLPPLVSKGGHANGFSVAEEHARS